jgi:beta-lactamase class A
MPVSRRTVLSAAALPLATCAGGLASTSALEALEAQSSGRLGVFALETGSRAEIAWRADERFAMCSTFKWVLAAAVLARVDAGALDPESTLAIRTADILPTSPVTERRVSAGGMSIIDLCAATVMVSDNAAANLLLRRIGGPAAVTAFVRTMGDRITRLDREELALNSNLQGDPRDTTSPRAMAATLRRVLLEPGLSTASQERIIDWMVRSPTGSARLRAGLPRAWRVADKTGTGRRGATNDVGIVWPPGRAPIVIAAYFTDSARSQEDRNAVLAAVGRIVADQFA